MQNRYPQLVDLLGSVYDQVTGAVADLEDRDFLRRTRAKAWCVQDLLFHLLLDAQRALLTFATPTSAEPDVDAVTYWLPFRPGDADASAPHARFVTRAASAYAAPWRLVRHWRDTAGAARRAASAAEGTARFETQGHVLTAFDFVSTLTVEATIHYLDLTVDLHADPPPPDALRLVRGVLDGLLGHPGPAEWDDLEYALKATGRRRLDAEDTRRLGGRPARWPLLG